MKRIMISAMTSGSGKTVVTCALLRALQRKGIAPAGFKCGPDYIDPMFHRKVLGIPTHNLDLFLQKKENLLRTLRSGQGELAVLEGAMGYYDGIGGTEQGSAWAIAELTDTPVILVLRPSGVGVTLAAQVKGLIEFRKPNRIAGLILNDCKPSLADYLKPILLRECGIPVLGVLPHLEEAQLASRHLGLLTADEIPDFEHRIDLLAERLENGMDWETFFSLCRDSTELTEREELPKPSCRIAVARDEAFCFAYEENLEALQKAGAELVFFSPLRDGEIPDADGLYLVGGYPELYREKLSRNQSCRGSVKNAVLSGMPTVAECGGFLYLQDFLEESPMAGVFSGKGFSTEHLQRFGYLTIEAGENSMLFRKGEAVPSHEFHYWDCTENGSALMGSRANGKKEAFGFCSESMYAGFPHLCFFGELPLAQRFVSAAKEYRKKNDFK